jgi:hypothetical protein
MRTTRVNVPLDTSELTALVRMAETDCRHPREQMRYLLREEAYKRGLLSHEQLQQEEEQDGEVAVTGS